MINPQLVPGEIQCVWMFQSRNYLHLLKKLCNVSCVQGPAGHWPIVQVYSPHHQSGRLFEHQGVWRVLLTLSPPEQFTIEMYQFFFFFLAILVVNRETQKPQVTVNVFILNLCVAIFNLGLVFWKWGRGNRYKKPLSHSDQLMHKIIALTIFCIYAVGILK